MNEDHSEIASNVVIDDLYVIYTKHGDNENKQYYRTHIYYQLIDNSIFAHALLQNSLLMPIIFANKLYCIFYTVVSMSILTCCITASSKIFVAKRVNKKFSIVYIIACALKRSKAILLMLNGTASASIGELQKCQLFCETIVGIAQCNGTIS
jgi:hypothetical protein